MPSDENLPSGDGWAAAPVPLPKRQAPAEPPANLARPEMREKPTVILGAGPAGLTAGYTLARMGLPVVVLEAEDQVGGIAKTAVRDGYRFDLGGHRFFTKANEVNALWHEIM
ncbi:MAG TPA: NAD(P)-binding protein, partial [Thermoleophilaceae bacterium]|nr:NAD(P)-binding protein [Thermoleophilaceae bacterium]